MKLHNRYIEICKSLNWNVTQYQADYGSDEYRVQLTNRSPLGEKLALDFGIDSFVDEVKEYAAYYNPDEHVKYLIDGKDVYEIPSIRELLNDADEIDKMLRKLASDLFQAELQMEARQ